MKIIILHNDSCSFRLKNGKEIILKGHHEINELSNADFNALLAEYPHLKIWEEKGFITFNDKKQDNLKADNAMNDVKKETERNEKAVEQAKEIIDAAYEEAEKIKKEAASITVTSQQGEAAPAEQQAAQPAEQQQQEQPQTEEKSGKKK